MPGFFSRGSVSTGGPTASRACENWRVPGAGADPNPDEPLVPVPVPGGAGCFRAEKLQEFLLVILFVLKIGPDWGIFSRANVGGKDSLRHELPHTRNPGLVRATVLPVDSFWCVTSKLPRDFGLERAL